LFARARTKSAKAPRDSELSAPSRICSGSHVSNRQETSRCCSQKIASAAASQSCSFAGNEGESVRLDSQFLTRENTSFLSVWPACRVSKSFFPSSEIRSMSRHHDFAISSGEDPARSKSRKWAQPCPTWSYASLMSSWFVF